MLSGCEMLGESKWTPQEPSAKDRYVTATPGNAAAKPEETRSLSQPR